MFNTQKFLDILSFHTPSEINLQGNIISPGHLTLIRDKNIYNFYRYEQNSNGEFTPELKGYILVSEGSLFFQKLFNVDLIEEADINL